MSRTRMAVLCTLVASLALFVGTASAQSNYTVDYFANANTTGAPDATTRIINPGSSTVGAGDLCADIYVFDANEELSECCSCLTTPDGLLTLSVNTDLTANPLTGVSLSTGVIKVVSAYTTIVGGQPTCPLPTKPAPANTGLNSWTTHIQNASFAITETGAQNAVLSESEDGRLASECRSIAKVGSGKGVCANSAALASICNN